MKRRKVLAATVLPVLALAVASAVGMPRLLAYNASASAPIGFYWLDHQRAERGDYVLVSVPERVRTLIETRHYLPPGVPLVKTVAAVGHDKICRRDLSISINGEVRATAKLWDQDGRFLPAWTGCKALSDVEVFLLQPNPDSFDSRYFGPIDRSLIIGRAVRLRFPWEK